MFSVPRMCVSIIGVSKWIRVTSIETVCCKELGDMKTLIFSNRFIRKPETAEFSDSFLLPHLTFILKMCHWYPRFSGRQLVMLVFVVQVLSDVWRGSLHENTNLQQPPASLRRGHLPGSSHWGGTVQHAALSRYSHTHTHTLMISSYTGSLFIFFSFFEPLRGHPMHH